MKSILFLERAESRMAETGLTDNDIWRLANVKMEAVRKHAMEGHMPSPPVLYSLASALETTRRYLEGATDDPAIPPPDEGDRLEGVKFSVPLSDAEKKEMCLLLFGKGGKA